jgi:amphi-Trp domain-containing protein
MSNVDRTENRLSRQKAAERLTDIAYAVTTGGRLSLGGAEEVTIPAADHVALEWGARSEGGRVELVIELSWEE